MTVIINCGMNTLKFMSLTGLEPQANLKWNALKDINTRPTLHEYMGLAPCGEKV